jgi:diguanylate cyclase (GGDEF)-like protein
MVLGEASLFDRAEAFTQEIDIPGGKWLIAVRSLRDTGSDRADFLIRLLSIALASISGWMMYMLIRSRSDLAALAMYDQLTGLPNRHLLEDRADMVFARHRRKPEQTCAILFLDLDGFKSINDSYGHKAGDAVLLAVAQRAKEVVRANDTIARWGGDEFIVLMDEVEPETLQPLVDRLRSEIEAPVMFEGQSLRVGVSVGVATCPAVGGTLDQVLKMADRQMYEEKVKRKAA